MNRVFGLASLCALVLLSVGCTKNVPVADADREIMLRAADLIPYGYGLEKTEQYEKFEKLRYFDGSHEINYTYETPDSEKDNALYLYSTVSIEKKVTDAWTTDNAQVVGFNIGLKSSGIKKREIENFYKYGDKSAFYVLEKDGKPLGNMFTVRDGKHVLLLIMMGMYFEDAATWKELVEPRLRKFSAYRMSGS